MKKKKPPALFTSFLVFMLYSHILLTQYNRKYANTYTTMCTDTHIN